MSKTLKSKIIFILPLILFIGIVLMLFIRLNKTSNQIEQSTMTGTSNDVNNISVNTSINKSVPDFQLPSLADATKKLSNKNLPKEAFLLNVWGSWCIACSREHPLLMKLHTQGYNIVGVNYKDEREYAIKLLNATGNPFMFNVYDEEGDLGIDLGLTGAPESFIVDAQGTIRQHIVGEITTEIWSKRIEPCFNIVKANNKPSVNPSEKTLASICK